MLAQSFEQRTASGDKSRLVAVGVGVCPQLGSCGCSPASPLILIEYDT